MSNQTQRLKFTQLAASIALVAGGAAFVPAAYAAAPAAGTNISNVASATYTDSTGASKQVNSNIVTTTVSQVGSFTLVADRTANANNNALVSLSHTLTNTGNGTDTFTLTVTDVANGTGAGKDDYDFSNIKIYLDANNDGIPDGAPITSVTLTAGQSVNLIVEGTTDATAAVGKKGQWDLEGTSGATPAFTVTNTDTVTIINGAVVTLKKSASINTVDATKDADADRTVTYTLIYQNTGNSTATNVLVTDVLDSKLVYVVDSAKLMGVDQTDADSSSVDNYKFDTSAKTLTLTIPSLAPNTTGTLTFKAVVKKDTDVGTILNTAEVDPGTGKTPSNPNNITVLAVPKGVINDRARTTPANVAEDTYSNNQATTALDKDDKIIIADVKQGQVAVFGGAIGERIFIHNTGNVAEEFNVAVSNGNLPPGSIVTLYQADGVTPFVSTGSVAKGGSYELVAKITLPANHADSVVRTATLITSPKSDSSKTDSLNLVITKVTPATVDLHNGKGTGEDGTGSTVGTGQDSKQFVDIVPVLPGQSATFPLQVDNLGSVSDNFNLSHNLPAGWDVKFYLADVAGTGPTGSPITNTGNINASKDTKFVVVVTPPAGATAEDKEVLFTITSPSTGLSDTMSDKLTVKADRKLVLNQDRIGQVAPGGTVVYKHTLTNNSNLIEGTVADGGLPFSLTSTNTDWATSLYVDVNNDGNIDAGDTLVIGTNLAAFVNNGNGIGKGIAINLLVKVQAPVNATIGTQNPEVLTFSPVVYNTIVHPILKNTDLTIVTAGQVRLVKDQAKVDCTAGTVATYTQTTVSAKPGECVRYRITATNEGNATVTDVVISDNTPSYTTLKAIATVGSESPKASNATLGGISADGTTGTVSATQPSLAPNANASLEFVIKVNN